MPKYYIYPTPGMPGRYDIRKLANKEACDFEKKVPADDTVAGALLPEEVRGVTDTTETEPYYGVLGWNT